jgi:hypothetical protein
MPTLMIDDGADAIRKSIRNNRAPTPWLSCDFGTISNQIARRVGDTGRLNDSPGDRALEGGIRPQEVLVVEKDKPAIYQAGGDAIVKEGAASILVRTAGAESDGLDGRFIRINDGAIRRGSGIFSQKYLRIYGFIRAETRIVRGFQNEGYLSLATGIGRYKPITASSI